MRVSNLKVRTPSIPSRTAANQFIDQHGYDIEWQPSLGLFYIHDIPKDKLHVVHMDEVMNFALAVESPADFMKQLREALPPVAPAPKRSKVVSD